MNIKYNPMEGMKSGKEKWEMLREPQFKIFKVRRSSLNLCMCNW